MIQSSVEAHPELLTVPTFVLFVQKDELAMSRAEIRKENRRESQKEFEDWLYQQTAPRQPQPKKQMQNEESLTPVDDKEHRAVAVRAGGVQGAQIAGVNGQKISRPTSDGFRPRGRSNDRTFAPTPQARSWNSQRGPARASPATDVSPPVRSRATTMADTLAMANAAMADPAQVTQNAAAPHARGQTRKTPTPRPGVNGRPKTPTPRAGKSPTPRRQSVGTPPRRPPSARGTPRKESPSARKVMTPKSGNSHRASSPGIGSSRQRPLQQRIDPAS
jgi:hypothetical protein